MRVKFYKKLVTILKATIKRKLIKIQLLNKRNTALEHEELTLKILKNIETTSSQKFLANELEISVGKVNYVLKALIEKGLVKAENFFANKNKNQYKYLLTKEGFQTKLELTEKFIKRKKEEYEILQKDLDTMKGHDKWIK